MPRPSDEHVHFSSGAWGCGASWNLHWLQIAWDAQSLPLSISVKQMLSIILAAAVWGGQWRGRQATCYCDNQAVVAVLSSRACREDHLMHMLRCLFYIEAYHDFSLRCMHIPESPTGRPTQSHAMHSLLYAGSRSRPGPTANPTALDQRLAVQRQGLVIADLEGAVRFYYSQGLAQSTRRTYDAGMRRFYRFCDAYNISAPFPVSESTLCYFVTVLANDNLAARTIKTYLAAVRDTPGSSRSFSYAKARPNSDRDPPSPRFPRKEEVNPLAPDPSNPRTHEAPLGLARRRELATVPSDVRPLLLWFFPFGRAPLAHRSPSRALLRGDVTFNHASQPTLLKIHLHVAKCYQFGKGTDVFIGKTGNAICPVDTCLAYVAIRGAFPGPFFRTRDSKPLLKSSFVSELRKVLTALGCQPVTMLGTASGSEQQRPPRQPALRIQPFSYLAAGTVQHSSATSGRLGSNSLQLQP